MAAAAILNLLFLSILVTRSTSGFLVAANDITAKFHSSTPIGGRVIAVCAKIQDGGRRHFGFYICLIFWHFCM